jgi:hypothetical protein
LIPSGYAVWALPPEESSKWAKAGWTDNAVLLVGRLSGPPDRAAVMRCAFTVSRRMPDWYELSSDADDFDGWPSAQIIGAYTVAGLTFWSCTRYMLVDYGTGPFLVQLTVTTRVHASRDGSAIAASLSVQAPAAETDESGGISFHI